MEMEVEEEGGMARGGEGKAARRSGGGGLRRWRWEVCTQVARDQGKGRQRSRRRVTRKNREVVDFTRYRVKNNTELTNLMKMNRIQGYNGKYGSNPQGIKQFLDVIFKFDQIGQEIDGRNWGKRYFKKIRLQIDSTESKIVQFGLDFAEKSNFEVERNFGPKKSRF